MNRGVRFTVFLALAALAMLLVRVVIIIFFENNNSIPRPYIDSVPEGLEHISERIAIFDFESGPSGDSSIRQDAARSGQFGMVLNARHQFSPGLFIPASEWGGRDSTWIVAEAWVMSPAADSLPQAFLVFTGNRQGQTFKFRAVPVPATGTPPGQWSKVRRSWLVPTGTDPGDKLQVYLMNSGNEELCIDDFTIDRIQIPPNR